VGASADGGDGEKWRHLDATAVADDKPAPPFPVSSRQASPAAESMVRGLDLPLVVGAWPDGRHAGLACSRDSARSNIDGDGRVGEKPAMGNQSTTRD
jgi:hypothetical protein